VSAPDREPREAVLDTVERVSEMCFGLFMALTFVGAVSALGGSDSPQAMFNAALGCNLAWGLVDAIMYLVRTLTMRGKALTIAMIVRNHPDPAQAIAAMRAALPEAMRAIVEDRELETIRARFAATPKLPDRPRFTRKDFVGALGIFLIVVATTFPVALPFVMMSDGKAALLVSRLMTLVMLFGGGMALGRYSGYGGWKAGFAMTAVGIALTAAIIALGG
jgi:VIT1/CCC1 family predicted Fe2+/Mn2+ transporter